MNKFIKKLKSLIPTKRKLVQLYTALLFNANLKGFVSGDIYQGNTKQMCVPGLNCYSCPGAIGACPLGSLQGSFSADKSTLFYVGGILLLYSLLFGRMICGWLCPFGLIQELIYKIRTPKLKKGPVTRILSVLKYVILVYFVFIVPIMYALRDVPLPAFCKYICPAGTLEGGVGLLSNEANSDFFAMLGPLFTWKFLLLVSFIVGSIFVFRLFCRFFCPLGALYGLFNKISLFGVKVEDSKCTHCDLCVNRCKMDVKKVGDRECISCGECVSVCPTKAIVWKGPSFKLAKSEIGATDSQEQPKTLGETVKEHKTARIVTRSISAVLLVALLVGAYAYYWNEGEELPDDPPAEDVSGDVSSDASDESQTSAPEAKLGNKVGDLCYGGSLKIADENGISDKVIDPASMGKITVINFWGTWCTPCVAELPYFDRIALEYDNVSVIAIHSEMKNDTAPDYIKKYYPDSKITFAVDNDKYYNRLGGRTTYPYTVVLDEDGIIVSVTIGSLTYEELKATIDGIK